MYYKIQIKST